MSLQAAEILFYVEDPGAANFMVHLPPKLKEKGYSCAVVATGKATAFFEDHGVDFILPVPSISAGEVLDAVCPRVVLTGISEDVESLGLFLTSEGKKRGLMTVGVVDTAVNAEYCFRGRSRDPLTHAPTLLLVTDEWDKDVFMNMGFPPERVFICGHPQYDFVRSEGLRLAKMGRDKIRAKVFPTAGDNRKIGLFASEISTGLNPEQFLKSEDYSLAGRGGSKRRTDIVLEELLDALRLVEKRPFLVLRLHPKNNISEFINYLDEFDCVSRDEPVLEVLYAADYVFGMTSMIMLEAAILGRPTFSIVPREIERQWLPTIRTHVTPCATTREEIRAQLPDFMSQVGSEYGAVDKGLFAIGASERAISVIAAALQTPSFTLTEWS